MKSGRLKDAVLAAFGDSEEMTLDQLRAVVFSVYSEPELLRRGAYCRGVKNVAAAAYAAGEPISERQRASLVSLGIAHVVREITSKKKSWIAFDKEKGAVTRVRENVA